MASSGRLLIEFIALSTSDNALCISVLLLNSKRIFAIPSLAVDLVCLTLLMYLTFSSTGFISDSSISLGLAPGHSTLIVM